MAAIAVLLQSRYNNKVARAATIEGKEEKLIKQLDYTKGKILNYLKVIFYCIRILKMLILVVAFFLSIRM